jgi:hypothetical protein
MAGSVSVALGPEGVVWASFQGSVDTSERAGVLLD